MELSSIAALIFCSIFAYLAGSIPFGKIIGKKRGVDIQRKGSGNIGFTNSLRVLGRKAALIVLLGDVLKGFLPVFAALRILPQSEALLVAAITILAHIFPVWLKFKGGKGIATAFGVTLALNPVLAGGGIGIFLVLIFSTKIVSLSSILTAWFLLLLTAVVAPSLTIFYLFLAVLVVWTHRGNIGRLMAKKESRVRIGS